MKVRRSSKFYVKLELSKGGPEGTHYRSIVGRAPLNTLDNHLSVSVQHEGGGKNEGPLATTKSVIYSAHAVERDPRQPKALSFAVQRRWNGPKPKYRHLLQDQEVRRWYDNVCRGSSITADVYLRRLGFLCNAKEIADPNEHRGTEQEKEEKPLLLYAVRGFRLHLAEGQDHLTGTFCSRIEISRASLATLSSCSPLSRT